MTPPNNRNQNLLSQLADMLESRLPKHGGNPDTSYAARLFSKGPDAILKKIGEESAELIMAAKDNKPEQLVYETADLWFHCLLVLAYYNLRPEDVLQELARRQGTSGLAEKASRSSTS
ncbi:MAG TPA: phosphoribosyl-ATP diphosphatase [Burkholderiaceae bacterium]|nr:phosphoribosyl-ATP diphosphatase [Burkholderiaceae bacterium]